MVNGFLFDIHRRQVLVRRTCWGCVGARNRRRDSAIAPDKILYSCEGFIVKRSRIRGDVRSKSLSASFGSGGPSRPSCRPSGKSQVATTNWHADPKAAGPRSRAAAAGEGPERYLSESELSGAADHPG